RDQRAGRRDRRALLEAQRRFVEERGRRVAIDLGDGDALFIETEGSWHGRSYTSRIGRTGRQRRAHLPVGRGVVTVAAVRRTTQRGNGGVVVSGARRGAFDEAWRCGKTRQFCGRDRALIAQRVEQGRAAGVDEGDAVRRAVLHV